MKKIIFLSLILIFFIKIQNIFASSNTFVVDNIIVSGKKIHDNYDYRERFLEIAFKKGFQNLIEGILKKKDQKKLLSTNLKSIKSLIENYRVVEEKISENEYSAKIEITFSKKNINNFFLKNKISYSELVKLDMIIYPILIVESELRTFEENNFFNEWNENEDFKGMNFVMPIENADDIDFIKKNILNLEEINLSQIIKGYEIKDSTIMIIRHENQELDIFLKSNFRVIKKIKRINFSVENLDNKEVRKDIILSLKSSINDLWKEENLMDISVPSYLTVNSKIRKPEELQAIIKKLKNINLIDNCIVQELNKDSVKIKIRYFGKIKNLQNSFLDNGFTFEILHDEWNLSLNS